MPKQENMRVGFKLAPNKSDKFSKASMIKVFKALGGFRTRRDREVFVTDVEGFTTLWFFEHAPYDADAKVFCTMCEGEGNKSDKDVMSTLLATKDEDEYWWEAEYETEEVY